MENEKNHRVSTPSITKSVTEEPFKHFRSQRTHRSHNHITKQPEVSVIIEVDTDNESAEERSQPQIRNKLSSSNSQRSVSMERLPPLRMGSTRDSRRSTKSISTISTKSLSLTTTTRYGSSQSINQSSGINTSDLQQRNSNVHGSTSSIQSNTTAPVLREQYFCCRKWSKREKILTTVVATLVFLVCGLAIAIGIVAERRAERNRENFSFKF